MIKYTKFNTDDEIAFLEGIGTWTDKFLEEKGGKLRLLKGYLRGSLLRERWGDIDRDIVLEFVNSEIHRLQNERHRLL